MLLPNPRTFHCSAKNFAQVAIPEKGSLLLGQDENGTHTHTLRQLACLPLYCGRHEVAEDAWTLMHTHTHISIQIVSCQINKDRQWAGQVRLLLLLSCMCVCVCVPGMYARVRALLLNHLWLTVAISGNEVGREVTTIESISIHRLHYAHPAAPSLSFLFLLFCQFYLIGFASGHS